MVSFFIPGGQFKGVVKTASKSLVGTGTKVLNDVKRLRVDERGAVSLPLTTKKGENVDNAYGLGGNYSDLKKKLEGDLRSNNIEVHHMPSRKFVEANGMDGDEGLSIVIDKFDHRKTRTYGGKNTQAFAEDIQGTYITALNRDIADIRSIAGDKYDVAIENMLNYARKNGRI